MELISGKEALIALANGEKVQLNCDIGWCDINDFEDWDIKQFTQNVAKYEFRLKPRTITLNGIEVPAPFDPEVGEEYFYLNLQRECLYAAKIFNKNHSDNSAIELGAWRTEEEIKQVVDALRKVFKEPQQ